MVVTFAKCKIVLLVQFHVLETLHDICCYHWDTKTLMFKILDFVCFTVEHIRQANLYLLSFLCEHDKLESTCASSRKILEVCHKENIFKIQWNILWVWTKCIIPSVSLYKVHLVFFSISNECTFLFLEKYETHHKTVLHQ